jgi:hypothetical protein
VSLVSLVVREEGKLPAVRNATVCCDACPGRVQLTVPHGLELHHREDGTQCPASWPAYVAGAPVPGRRAPVVHGIPRRKS